MAITENALLTKKAAETERRGEGTERKKERKKARKKTGEKRERMRKRKKGKR